MATNIYSNICFWPNPTQKDLPPSPQASDADNAPSPRGEKGSGGDGASADADKGGGKNDDDGDDDLEWGVYLRTEEDSDRTKREWEKEHGDWVEDQV